MIDLAKCLRFYAVTNNNWKDYKKFLNDIETSLANGVTLLQLREKNISLVNFIREARDIKKLCQAYSVPLVINDNLEVALSVGADALHIGQTDGNVREIKKQLPSDIALGVSATNVTEAKQAEADGADYLGVGAIFATQTKQDAASVSLETLREITGAVKIPVVAIGGICEDNIKLLEGTGISGVALVSAIYGADNTASACKKLSKIIMETKF